MILHFKDKIDYNDTKIGQKHPVRLDKCIPSWASPKEPLVENSDLIYPELFTSEISYYDLANPLKKIEIKRTRLKDARLICNVKYSDYDDVFPSDESEIEKTKRPWTGFEKNTAFFHYTTQWDSMNLSSVHLDSFKTKYDDACKRFFAQMEILNNFYYNVICQENIAGWWRIRPNKNEKIVVTLLLKDNTSSSIVEFLCDGIIHARFDNVVLGQEGLYNQIPESIFKSILGNDYQIGGSKTHDMYYAIQKVIKDFEWKGIEATLNYPNDTVVKVIQLDDYPQRIPDLTQLTPDDLSGFKITDISLKTVSLNYTITRKYQWHQDNMHDCMLRTVEYVSYDIYIDFPLFDMKKKFMAIVDDNPCNKSEKEISQNMDKISRLFGQGWRRVSGKYEEEADITEISLL